MHKRIRQYGLMLLFLLRIKPATAVSLHRTMGTRPCDVFVVLPNALVRQLVHRAMRRLIPVARARHRIKCLLSRQILSLGAERLLECGLVICGLVSLGCPVKFKDFSTLPYHVHVADRDTQNYTRL